MSHHLCVDLLSHRDSSLWQRCVVTNNQIARSLWHHLCTNDGGDVRTHHRGNGSECHQFRVSSISGRKPSNNPHRMWSLKHPTDPPRAPIQDRRATHLIVDGKNFHGVRPSHCMLDSIHHVISRHHVSDTILSVNTSSPYDLVHQTIRYHHLSNLRCPIQPHDVVQVVGRRGP